MTTSTEIFHSQSWANMAIKALDKGLIPDAKIYLKHALEELNR